jgi:hypothetical protein
MCIAALGVVTALVVKGKSNISTIGNVSPYSLSFRTHLSSATLNISP